MMPTIAFWSESRPTNATLQPGAWKLDVGRVITSLEEPRDFDTYMLATDLTQDEVARSFSSAESVPFWELPKVRDRTEGAGLDATGYRLQYQTLLARPLLLVAMVLIAAAFSLRFFRFGGVTRMVASGVGAGFILYVATKVVADLGSTGLLSASRRRMVAGACRQPARRPRICCTWRTADGAAHRPL